MMTVMTNKPKCILDKFPLLCHLRMFCLCIHEKNFPKHQHSANSNGNELAYQSDKFRFDMKPLQFENIKFSFVQ